MNESTTILLYGVFAVCWAMRLRSLRMLLRVYRFHGPDWWFDFRMPPDFYQREGKDLLRRLRIRMLAPYAVETPLTVVLVWWRGPLWGMFVSCAFAVAGGFHNTATLKAFARAGRPFALADQKPNSAMPLSLQPRATQDYAYGWAEWTLRAAIGISLVLLVVALIRPGSDRDAVGILTLPAVLLYVLAGLRLIKGGIVDWRIPPAPGVDPDLLLFWQDAVRRQVLLPFEWARGCAVLIFTAWALLCVRPRDWSWHTSATWILLYPLVTVWLVMIMSLLRAQRKFVALAKTIKPDGWRGVEPPAPEGTFYLWGRLCFHPDKPTMIVRGPRGIALNASHGRARLSLAYLGGWVVLAVGITAVLR